MSLQKFNSLVDKMIHTAPFRNAELATNIGDILKMIYSEVHCLKEDVHSIKEEISQINKRHSELERLVFILENKI